MKMSFNTTTSSAITPRIWRSYALADVSAAHADLEQGRSQGAIILVP